MFTKALIAASAFAMQLSLADRTFWWDETTNKHEIGWFKS